MINKARAYFLTKKKTLSLKWIIIFSIWASEWVSMCVLLFFFFFLQISNKMLIFHFFFFRFILKHIFNKQLSKWIISFKVATTTTTTRNFSNYIKKIDVWAGFPFLNGRWLLHAAFGFAKRQRRSSYKEWLNLCKIKGWYEKKKRENLLLLLLLLLGI